VKPLTLRQEKLQPQQPTVKPLKLRHQRLHLSLPKLLRQRSPPHWCPPLPHRRWQLQNHRLPKQLLQRSEKLQPQQPTVKPLMMRHQRLHFSLPKILRQRSPPQRCPPLPHWRWHPQHHRLPKQVHQRLPRLL